MSSVSSDVKGRVGFGEPRMTGLVVIINTERRWCNMDASVTSGDVQENV